MVNLNKRNPDFDAMLSDSDFSTKIRLFFSTRTVGEDFDLYEQNYKYTDSNPITVKGYVRDIKSEALVWKQYGLAEVGAKEIFVSDKYLDFFKLCNRIEIDGDSYQVYKENVGNRALIEKRPFRLARIIIQKVK